MSWLERHSALIQKLLLTVMVCGVLVFYFVAASSQENVPAEQWIEVVGVNAGGGEEFPPEASVWYVIHIHNEADPERWVCLADSLAHPGAGDTTRIAYDIPKDGLLYQFRSVAWVDWGDGVVEEDEPCLSAWRRARRIEQPEQPCGWATRR